MSDGRWRRTGRSFLRACGWLLLWGATFVATLVLYDLLLLERARDRHQAAMRSVDDLTREVRELEVVAGHLSAFQREVQSLSDKLATLERMLPPVAQVPAIAVRFRERLERRGLRLLRVTPGSTEGRDFYARTAFELEVSGPWPELLALPEILRNDFPVVEVRGLDVEPDGATHRARVRCWTYSQAAP